MFRRMANVQVEQDVTQKLARLDHLVNGFNNGIITIDKLAEAIEIIAYLTQLLQARRDETKTVAIIRLLRRNGKM